MKLKDVPVGSYVTRPWYKRNYKNKLRIHVYQLTKTVSIQYRYIDSTCSGYRIVPINSTAWDYDDYVFCDKDGNILENQPQKEQHMATCYSAKIIVATNTNVSASFDTEDSALEWVAAKLEEAPRTKFKMFKPYQTIEPKIPDLSSLIKKIEE